MSEEFLSVAIWEALPGKDAESMATIRELGDLIAKRGYGRDLLYRSSDANYVLLRYWKSEQAQQSALEDPDLLRCWARLATEIRTVKVYEKLAGVQSS